MNAITDLLANFKLPPKDREKYLQYKLRKSVKKMDYFFSLSKACGYLLVPFHALLFLFTGSLVDLLYAVIIAIVFASFKAPPSIRASWLYGHAGMSVAASGIFGVTISMASGDHDLQFDPVILPTISAVFCLLNGTQQWYGGTLYLLLMLVLNSLACLWAYGLTLTVQRTLLSYVFLIVLHGAFSIREEMNLRVSFLNKRTICNLKDSFESTIEAIPSALIVKSFPQQEGEEDQHKCASLLSYANPAFKELFAKEGQEEDLDAALNNEKLTILP